MGGSVGSFGTEIDPLVQLRVLIIEDQADVAQALKLVIERDGMQTAWAATGAAAVELMASFDPHVALVDLGLPDTNGLMLIRWLVAKAHCGIIVVSGQTDEADCVAALEIGADDYVAKPPSVRELVARIHAVYRRAVSRRLAPTTAEPVATPMPRPLAPTTAEPVATPMPRPHNRPVMTIGHARVDLARRQAVSHTGEDIHLTSAEFTVLEMLVDAGGAAVSREKLFAVALRRPMHFEDRAIDQIIFALRRKLAQGEAGRRLIQSIRGQGYSLLLGDQEPADWPRTPE